MRSALAGLENSPSVFAVCVSNVPGPSGALSVAGRPVRSFHNIAEIGLRHGLRISVLSAAGSLHFGFCTDPHAVPDVDVIVEGVIRTADELFAADGATR